jgi:hypothetical protein
MQVPNKSENPPNADLIARIARRAAVFLRPLRLLIGEKRSLPGVAVTIDQLQSPASWRLLSTLSKQRSFEIKVPISLWNSLDRDTPIPELILRCHQLTAKAPIVKWLSDNVSPVDGRSSAQAVISARETARGELTFVLRGAQFVKNEVVAAFLHSRNLTGSRSKLRFDIRPKANSLSDQTGR